MQKEKAKWNYWIVVITVAIFFWYFVGMAFRGTKGDDYNFVLQSSEYSLLEWIYTRFMTRSGRIAAEAFIWIFAHVPLICWKVVTMLLSISLGVYLYKYAMLFGSKPNMLLSFFCAMAPFLIGIPRKMPRPTRPELW